MIKDLFYDYLIKNHLADPDLLKALYDQDLFCELVLEMNIITVDEWGRVMSYIHGRPFMSLDNVSILEMSDYWGSHRAIPFLKDHNGIYHIACANLDHLPSTPHVAYQGIPYEIDAIILKHSKKNFKDLPTIEAVVSILQQAILKDASDIHIYPQKYYAILNERVCGRLQNPQYFSLSHYHSIIIRLKVLSNLDITQTYEPQSGHFEHVIGGRNIDCRVSFHPTIWGESVAIRLLNRAICQQSLQELGFSNNQGDALMRIKDMKSGLVLISGATGSGKTTTLYALLQTMDASSRSIMTLEEPVEFFLPMIRQTMWNHHQDFLKSLMRHDPDVILIGEIRDQMTTQLAMRAALTGHLVLSTVHAQDIFHIPARLIDLGADLSLLSSQSLCYIHQDLSYDNDTHHLKADVLIMESSEREALRHYTSAIVFKEKVKNTLI
jgi:type II secretory ATPase GspE/PulE/Tfp pilus assembly ATPase PilB-like protein